MPLKKHHRVPGQLRAAVPGIGACNTVIRGRTASFTDSIPMLPAWWPLEQRLHLQGAKILVLGAGGAARAAVFGLREPAPKYSS